MNILCTKENLKIEKANESDWNPILKLLEETNLTSWLTGNEIYKNFYTVKENDNKFLMCCFALEFEDEIGILKSFAIRKDLQGKGIGKHIANRTPEIAKRFGVKRLYAASIEAPNFWLKTSFKEIKLDEIRDSYFLEYLRVYANKIPNYYKQTLLFVNLIN